MDWKRRVPAVVLAAGLVLGTHGGYVALLRDGRPVRIYPVPVQCLPSGDQEALARGIRPGTQAELSALLEDFLS